MNLCKFLFFGIDNLLYNFFSNSVNIMPLRAVKFIAYYYPDARVRKLYLKILGVEMGENTFSNFGLLHIGRQDGEKVFIGDNVSIGPNLTLITESSPNNSKVLLQNPHIAEKICKNAPIFIADDVWLGANVTILPGVKIGKGSIIGACSLVNKDVPSSSIAFGVPAKVIRNIPYE